MKITDLIHQGTLDNVRAFNRHTSAARAFEDTVRRAAGPARTALALRATDAMRPAMLTQFHGLQRMVDQQSWIDRGMPKFGDLARVQGIGRGLAETAVRGVAASALANQSAMRGFDLAPDRINAALAAARPETAALRALVREPIGPALSSLMGTSMVPAFASVAGVKIGPRSTLRDLLPEVDFDAVIDSALDIEGEPADAIDEKQLQIAHSTLLWTRISWATSALWLLYVLSGDKRVQRLAQEMIDGLHRLSQSLSC